MGQGPGASGYLTRRSRAKAPEAGGVSRKGIGLAADPHFYLAVPHPAWNAGGVAARRGRWLQLVHQRRRAALQTND